MKISLNGTWQLLPVEEFKEEYPEEGWLSMEVPSHWQEHPQLESYAGKVVYRKGVSFKKRRGKRYRLRLNGIFYWSTVYLNGQFLGENEGYFFPQEYEVTHLLREENTLLVEVDCPNEEKKTGKRMITGVFSHWDCLDPMSNPGGIWLPVEILESGPVYIKRYRFQMIDIESARVSASLLLDAIQPLSVKVRITLTPHNFPGLSQTWERKLELAEGEKEWETTLEIGNPRLWWAHDLGHPNLYRVKVEVITGRRTRSDEVEFNFGLRTFEMRNWIAYLNRKRLFLKGNNYPPGDTRLARMTYEAYRRDLQLAKDAHMNMLRVHAHVEHPAFYEAADEAGILLWQDFPLQWHYRKEVLPQALRQGEKMIDLLFHHPSIAIWCMHNEPFWIAETTEALAARRTFLRWNFLRMLWSLFVFSWNREIMDSRLKRLAMRVDPTRFVVRSAGEWSLGLWRGGTDGHHYHGWYPASGPLRAFDNLHHRSSKDIRFVTEFGAQSFPNYESSIKFMDPDLEKIDWRHLEERHSLQWGNMRHWIDVEACQDLSQLIEATQDYQIHLNRFFIDRLRFHKYRPTGGVLAFLLLDPNPAIQWSVIDYWRVPKRSYYALKHAFHPQYVFTLLKKDLFEVGEEIAAPIYIVNDSQNDYHQVEVIAEVLNDQGIRTLHAAFSSPLEADSQAILVQNLTLRFPSPGDRKLLLTLRYGQEEFQNEYRLPVEG